MSTVDQRTQDTLKEVISALASIERGPGSAGEAAAADWIAERLREAGAEVNLEPASFYEGYAKPIAMLSGAAAVGALLGSRRRTRFAGAALAGASALLIADDIANGLRLFRKTGTPRRTQNVVAYAGDQEADRTLVLLAHHDAAPTGLIFDPGFQSWLGETFPGLIERIDTSFPLWWLVLAGPLLAAYGAARNRRVPALAGLAFSLGTVATMLDVARSPIVPGANDNASAVAVLVAIAERLREEPLQGLRVMLVSCGAEEVVQGGIYTFADVHFRKLPREKTWFLCLETLGSPNLSLLEGEGPVIMEDYCDKRFRDLVDATARKLGAPIRRGLRARNSTDAIVPSHSGYPTATLVSVDRNKALSNYHLMSDTAENIDYSTVAQALLVTEGVARELAAHRWL